MSSHIVHIMWQFKELQEAFNHIMAHLNDLEEAKLYRLAYYEAVVVKVRHWLRAQYLCVR